jgi:hypothetical protein
MKTLKATAKIVNNKKKNKVISKFKYISVSEEAKGDTFLVSIPVHKGTPTRVLSVSGLKKSVALRNRIGKKIWGDYWNAILSGYIDTIQSKTASVSVARRFDRRSEKYEWRVSSRGLISNKYKTKTFSENKFGAAKAEELARSYASIDTESRFSQLSNWKPRWIRRPRDTDSIYRNRGTLAVK